MITSSGWKLTTVLIFLILCSPLANSFTFDKNNEMNRDEYKLIIPDYINNWHVDKNRSIQDVETYIPNFHHERGTIIKTYRNPEDGERSDLMDSAWPMLSHDVYHTGLSQYSTAGNPEAEIWRVHGDDEGEVESSAVIDSDGIIYFGTMGSDHSLYTLYANGTRKWRFPASDLIWGTPALSEEGVIYFTTWGSYFYAVNPDGTERWLFNQESSSTSSSTIGEDGTIYFGTDGYNIFAINPNGTEKWRYHSGYIVMGSPAIGQDGTIYIGSGDHYLYALYPNGILRWRFLTGSEIKGSASIAPDGTIYIPSFDGYFYALYPNGTMKWRASTGDSIAAAGVALAEDGTIYVGSEQLRAFYPNGTLKWMTNVQGSLYGTVPAVSADGTIYVSAGLDLVAVNSAGIECWRHTIADTSARSSPSIGADGTVYVGSTWGGVWSYGYLHAFGLGPLRAEAGGPYQGTALRPITLIGLAFGGLPPYQYHWDFGDGNTSAEINPTHTYAVAGNYTVTFTITDAEGNISMDAASVTMDYPLPVLVITRPTNAFYIADKQLFPVSFPFIFGKITIKANVTYHYPITRVEFIIHGANQYTDTIPPYEWTWTQRNFRLKDNIYVIAYDTKGRYTEQKMDVIKWF
jgi:uncharacterized membrane protein